MCRYYLNCSNIVIIFILSCIKSCDKVNEDIFTSVRKFLDNWVSKRQSRRLAAITVPFHFVSGQFPRKRQIT